MNEDNQRGSEVGGGENAAGIWARGQKVGGIDVGSKQHWVCAPAREGEGREVQVFEATVVRHIVCKGGKKERAAETPEVI